MTAYVLLFATLAHGDVDRPVDFDTEVVAVLTRSGCNTGACHGAAVGRGGFKLSLLGGDPARDYDAIVHDLEGRRVNLERPEQSLLLRKPSGRLDHEGGDRLRPSTAGARRLLDWVRQGAPRINARKLVDFQVEPARLVVEATGTEVPLKATATFDDGTTEIVTRWVVFTSVDASALTVRQTVDDAVAVVHRAGQNVLIARYLHRVVPVQFTTPLSTEPIRLADGPRTNLIDDAVHGTLATLRLPVSPPADDAAFLRRVRLDLTGRLPAPDEVRAFLADSAGDKRQRLVDRLLASKEFVEAWTFWLATLLRVRPQTIDGNVGIAFNKWVRDQVALGTPLDVVARTLLTATGDTRVNGPANFHLVAGDARSEAEYTAQVFLGVRLQCANCHDHPLDRWTQDDYHGLAAIFARIERGREVRVLPRGEVTHPRTGEAATPKLPGDRFLDPDQDCLAELADWITNPEHPQFARAIVNRLWKALQGRGLVEPVDDLRATNPATHPELLDALAADFVAHGYDLRHTLRLIATSATYARSADITPGNQADERFYSHALTRTLGAEVLADALSDVTGVAERYGSLPPWTRALMLTDPRIPSVSLDILGRCPRDGSCESGVTGAGGLAAKLHMLNGTLVNRKLTAPEGRLHQLIDAGRSDDEVLNEFALRALGRPPSDAQRGIWGRALTEAAASPAERAALLEDIVWGLLNSREFLTNH